MVQYLKNLKTNKKEIIVHGFSISLLLYYFFKKIIFPGFGIDHLAKKSHIVDIISMIQT